MDKSDEAAKSFVRFMKSVVPTQAMVDASKSDTEWPFYLISPENAAKEWIIGYNGRRSRNIPFGAYEKIANSFAIELLNSIASCNTDCNANMYLDK